jgi:hypothetical protein
VFSNVGSTNPFYLQVNTNKRGRELKKKIKKERNELIIKKKMKINKIKNYIKVHNLIWLNKN